MSDRNKKKRGFTLIEIMVVVVIIGLLATLVGPRVWQMLGFGQESIARTKCKEYYDVVSLWMLFTKARRVPDSLAEVERTEREDGRRFVHVAPDPWGSDFRIEHEGARSYRIWSNGPDGISDTDDDISSDALQR